ncbi:MAG: S9 family peptidase [Planctomycetes bacterium]|nr:S9 family peptidase [Planctomycetota bacterium]MBI3847739.1 S9 family peptidase [Planctomycetota bacterium]
MLGWLVWLVIASPASGPHVFTPEDAIGIHRVSDPQISPDGTRVAFVVTDLRDKGEAPNSDLFVVDARGGEPRRLTWNEKSDDHPRWSPDGRWLAFLSERGDVEGAQIHLLPSAGGEAQRLGKGKAAVDDFQWSADSRAIFYLAPDAPSDDEEKKKKEKDDARVVDGDLKAKRLHRIDVEGGKDDVLTPPTESLFAFSISPDGTRIAEIVGATPLACEYWRMRLVVMALDGSARREFPGPFETQRPLWSGDGKTIVALADSTHPLYGVWTSLSLDTGRVHRLLEGDRPTPIYAPPQIVSGSFVASRQDGLRQAIGRVHVGGPSDGADGDAFEPLLKISAIGTQAETFSISADGKHLAYATQSETTPEDVWVVDLPSGSGRRLTTMNPQLASIAFGELRDLRWKGADGLPVEGVLVLPVGYESGKRYPLVVEVHGGPAWNWWHGFLGSWHEWAQMLAGEGIAVLLPNPRGSTGYGREFCAGNFKDWGGKDLADIEAGVDEVVHLGIADVERLGFGGWSYGGFMTAWAMTRTTRYKAAVMGAGLSDLPSFHGTTDITPGFFEDNFGASPYTSPDTYRGRSAIESISKVKTPVLILHGEGDDRVPVSQAWEYYRGLKATGVETQLVVYPREPHSFHEKAHQLDLQRRVRDWFKQKLTK